MRVGHHFDFAGKSPSQRGLGLIEVLVTILVLSIGLLGIAAMQATALRNGQSALERSQAVIQTYSILEAMRANRVRALAGDYDYVMSVDCDPPAAGPLGAADVTDWLASLEVALGEGACGTIAREGNNNVIVTIQWNDSRGTVAAGDEAAAAARTLITRTQL